jgi:tRNA(Arg) A34 adenosine deaminase TadA
MVNKWMDEALDLATEALEVPVGCVFVHNDKAIAFSYSSSSRKLMVGNFFLYG